jgi:hypothetical protein
MFHVELILFLIEVVTSLLLCSTWNIQNYIQLSDVPRGTLNNDTNATNAQIASKIMKG